MQVIVRRVREPAHEIVQNILVYRSYIRVVFTPEEQALAEQYGFEPVKQLVSKLTNVVLGDDITDHAGIAVDSVDLHVVSAREDQIYRALHSLVTDYWPAALAFAGEKTFTIP